MGATAFNLPNMLSLSRVFLAPLVVLFLTLRIEWGDLIAGGVFILAALTDTADGYIARKRGIVTNLGKFIDPLADKILITAALVGLVELQRISAWIVVIILAREFVVTGLRMIAAAEGVVLAASRGGKAKTVSQIIAIVMMIFNVPLAIFAMWIALLLTVWSGMDYLMKGWNLLSAPPAQKP